MTCMLTRARPVDVENLVKWDGQQPVISKKALMYAVMDAVIEDRKSQLEHDWS